MTDYVVTRSGQRVSLTALIFGQHFHAFQRITKVQLRQHRPGECELAVIRTPDFNAADEAEMRARLVGCVGDELAVTFRYIAEIPLSAGGKHRFLIQDIPPS
jgi:phenylacetate-CoA ligase